MKKIVLACMLCIPSYSVGNIVEVLDYIQGRPYTPIELHAEALFKAIIEGAKWHEGESKIDTSSHITPIEANYLASAISIIIKRIVEVRALQSSDITAKQYNHLLRYLDTTTDLNHEEVLFNYPALLQDEYKINHVKFLLKSFCVALHIAYLLGVKTENQSRFPAEYWIKGIRDYLKDSGYDRKSFYKIFPLVQQAYVATWERLNSGEEGVNYYKYIQTDLEGVSIEETSKIVQEREIFRALEVLLDKRAWTEGHGKMSALSSLGSSEPQYIYEIPEQPSHIKAGYSPLTKALVTSSTIAAAAALLSESNSLQDRAKRFVKWYQKNPIKAAALTVGTVTPAALIFMKVTR